MNYSITINAPIDKVFECYTDNNNLLKWQKSLISYKQIKGNACEVGSVGEMTYKPVTIYETISSLTSPNEIICDYEHTKDGVTKMYHKATTCFNVTGEKTTEMTLNIDQKVVGFIPKMVMKLMANKVKQHHQFRLEEFKGFVEKQ